MRRVQGRPQKLKLLFLPGDDFTVQGITVVDGGCLCGLCVPPPGKKWVRIKHVSVQGGLGKRLGYGSPRG